MHKLIAKRRSNEAPRSSSSGVFSVPLAQSLHYAGSHTKLKLIGGGKAGNGQTTDVIVPITVPIVVYKCGSRLREAGINSDGIFRRPGAARRIAALQDIFDSPDHSYGADFVDWDSYSTEDAADLLRRYLARLPEPVIPPAYYDAFQAPLLEDRDGGDKKNRIAAYRTLIDDLPDANGDLLMYLLDLLAAFAAHADETRMPAASLAAVFHPSIFAEGGEGLDAGKHKRSQDVLEFLIEAYDDMIRVAQ